ncbi:orotidine 5'-phosphate decarboxylase [Pararhodobacter sp.]|uniref:orotidine 5'-phosphate decarboxylase n=1 Tax=Pararhodobacter sp. TaxID=2127056 RepID=UPI002AFE699F|nr:orotidine 5'-phosphate decarboxylase [Pararhodobacter sp.]
MEIKTLKYDAAAGAFEARVDIERDGRTFRYPCLVRGPQTMDPRMVRESVLFQVGKMSGLTSNSAVGL